MLLFFVFLPLPLYVKSGREILTELVGNCTWQALEIDGLAYGRERGDGSGARRHVILPLVFYILPPTPLELSSIYYRGWFFCCVVAQDHARMGWDEST